MSEKTTQEKIQELVQQHAAAIAELFPNVQIFCSDVEEGSDKHTLTYAYGLGNLQARVNQARDFVIRWEEGIRCDVREEREEEREEDDDE